MIERVPIAAITVRDRRRQEPSWVYFIGEECWVTPNVVKIGVSRDPIQRLAELQTGNARELHLIGVTPGGHAIEQAIHTLFAHARLQGEWFRLTDDLASFVIARVFYDGWLPRFTPITTVDPFGHELHSWIPSGELHQDHCFQTASYHHLKATVSTTRNPTDRERRRAEQHRFLATEYQSRATMLADQVELT